MTLTERINQIKSLQKDECWYITKQSLSFKDLCFAAKIVEEFKLQQNVANFETFFAEKAAIYGITPTHRMANNCYYIGLLSKNGTQYKDAMLTEAYFTIKASCDGDFSKTELYKDILISQIEKVFVSNAIDEENAGLRKHYKINPAFYLAKILLGLGDITGDYSITQNEFYRFVGTSYNYSFYVSTIELIIEQRKNRQLSNDLAYIDNYYNDLQNITIDNFSSNRIHLLLANLPYFEMTNGKISFVKGFIKEMKHKLADYECNLNDKYFTIEYLNSNKGLPILSEVKKPKLNIIFAKPPQNLIFFGCPGTGKSHRVTEKVKKAGFTEYKVTFHPEYDYANFVGAYKPFTEADKRITYQFVPQAFIKAYVAAWKNLDKPYCLTIEEINRGNCAAIFGDIFQLLDRDKTGFSQYTIYADTDIANYLKQELSETEYALHIQALCAEREVAEIENPYEILCLPPNLSLFATMNTSDQSLFPMDSAFKRRWQWQYVPIDYADAEQFTLKIGGKTYNWSHFLRTINDKIYNITESEDKQMGNRFVNPDEKIIDEEVFVNKVLFYLWFDIFKNEDNRNANYIFKTLDNQLLKYVELFLPDGKSNIIKVQHFLEYNKL
jgi:hypothetical protein